MAVKKAAVGKKATKAPSELVAVRLDSALLARVDAFAERLRGQVRGVRAGRSDAIRVLLVRALDSDEAQGSNG